MSSSVLLLCASFLLYLGQDKANHENNALLEIFPASTLKAILTPYLNTVGWEQTILPEEYSLL